MTILYTGFKGKNNSSCVLVNYITGDKLFLTNSFVGVKRDIDALNRKYDMVFMFGLDKNLTDSVRIELCAQKDGKLLYTAAGIKNIERELENNDIKYIVSAYPGNYLCNEAYYYMLEKMAQQAVFIHIPPIKKLTKEMINGIINAVS